MFYKKIMPARIPLRVYSGYILNIYIYIMGGLAKGGMLPSLQDINNNKKRLKKSWVGGGGGRVKDLKNI